MTEFALNKGKLVYEGGRFIIEDDVKERRMRNLLIGVLLCLFYCAGLVRLLYKPTSGFRLFSNIVLLVIYLIYIVDFVIRRVIKFSKNTEITVDDIVKYERVPGLYKESGEFKLKLRSGDTRTFCLNNTEDAAKLMYILNERVQN